MSGMINTAPTPGTGGAPASGLKNPLLQQVETKIEANIHEEQTRQEYQQIVTAGLHIALQGGLNSFAARIQHSRDPIGDVARSCVALVLVMRGQSKGNKPFPMQAGIPAGMTLLMHGLDFIDSAKIAKIAEPELEQATTIFVNTLFHKLGITPQMIQQLRGGVERTIADPGSVEKIKLKAGMTRHPMSVSETPMPVPAAPEEAVTQ